MNMNKILFAKRIKLHNEDNTYLAPFVYDAKGMDYLHEPNYNLLTSELAFKSEIIQNMKKALGRHNMVYIAAYFFTNMVKFKMKGE